MKSDRDIKLSQKKYRFQLMQQTFILVQNESHFMLVAYIILLLKHIYSDLGSKYCTTYDQQKFTFVTYKKIIRCYLFFYVKKN